MEVVDAIYLQARSLILADVGAGGLSATGEAFYIRGGVRRESDPPRTEGRPFIRVEVIAQEKSKEQAVRQADALVRFRIVFDRDAQREDAESIPSRAADRLQAILNAIVWGTQSGWDIGPGALINPGRYLADGKESALMVEYRVHADEV